MIMKGLLSAALIVDVNTMTLILIIRYVIIVDTMQTQKNNDSQIFKKTIQGEPYPAGGDGIRFAVDSSCGGNVVGSIRRTDRLFRCGGY
jgi:hypothetical protein